MEAGNEVFSLETSSVKSNTSMLVASSRGRLKEPRHYVEDISYAATVPLLYVLHP
jgi:hypothetical protein